MRQNKQRSGQRERLVNAAHRLARISLEDPLKLFRLLYMLDLRHFRAAGHSCTGETYYALADGPAPGTLRSVLVMRDLDIDTAIGVLTSTNSRGPWCFDPQHFSSRELAILDELEIAYGDVPSCRLAVEDANAWWRVYNTRGGVGAVIPYEMTLVSSGAGLALEKSARWWKFMRRLRPRKSTGPDYPVPPKPTIPTD